MGGHIKVFLDGINRIYRIWAFGPTGCGEGNEPRRHGNHASGVASTEFTTPRAWKRGANYASRRGWLNLPQISIQLFVLC
jgi:hypothetical protein